MKGGSGSEREVSLNTAKECAKAIKKLGCKITEVDISEIDKISNIEKAVHNKNYSEIELFKN